MPSPRDVCWPPPCGAAGLRSQSQPMLRPGPDWGAELAMMRQEMARLADIQSQLSAEIKSAPKEVSQVALSLDESELASAEFRRLLSRLLQQHMRELAAVKPSVLPAKNDAPDDNPEIDLVVKGSAESAEPKPNGYRRTLKLTAELEQAVSDAALAEGEDEDPAAKYQTTVSRVQAFLLSPRYEWSMMAVLALNVLFMGIELQYHGLRQGHDLDYNGMTKAQRDDVWPGAAPIFVGIDFAFTAVFFVDVCVRIMFFGCRFFCEIMNIVDFLVVACSIIQYAVPFPVPPVILRLIRLGKLVRALRVVKMSAILETLQLMIKCIVGSFNALVWSLLILFIIQCITGMIISNVVKGYLEDDSETVEDRREVYKYWGTFTRMILSMFEILFANWAPVARTLVEKVSETYTLVFLFYRCLVGFAVINVVNAVFVQQTMKVAQTDEMIQYKQREKSKESYMKKLKKAFTALDTSGDGCITMDEYAELLTNENLKFLMAQLEIDTHDLAVLFSLLDTGDGEISMTEFTEGITRLRGNAKNLDMAKMMQYARDIQDRLSRIEAMLE